MASNVNGEPLSAESVKMLDYLSARAAALEPGGDPRASPGGNE